MATNTIYTKILLRNDTTANWTTNKNVVLGAGEAGVEKLSTNKFKVKLGDGTRTWENLPYLVVDSSDVYDIQRTGDTGKVDLQTRIGQLIEACGKISVNGILKGDGTGNVSAAVADTDYRTPGQSKIDFNQTPTGYSAQVPAVITLGSNTLTPATLGTDGKVPATQLPSYVDDVIEGYYYNSKFYKESAHTTEITGETGKIYVDITEGAGNKTYRWSSGAGYIEISAQAVYTADGTTLNLSNAKQFSVIKVPNALTVGSKTFDGSAAVSIDASDIPFGDGTESIGDDVYEALKTLEGVATGLDDNKADKVSEATAGDIATLDSNGNLVDSGVQATNVLTKNTSATSGKVIKRSNDGGIENSDVDASAIITSIKKNGGTTGVTTSGHEIDIDIPVSGTGDNAVTVDSSDQEMTVDNVTTSILKNATGDVFIINGGNAAGSGEAPAS